MISSIRFQEFRPEGIPHRFFQSSDDRQWPARHLPGQSPMHHLGVQILFPRFAGHDDDGVTEVNCPPLSIRQATIFQDLQQRIPDIRVRFLDLVKQNDSIWTTTPRLQSTDHLARNLRSPEAHQNKRLTVCCSRYSLISTRTRASSSSNMNSASAFASSVLPTPLLPRKINEPIGTAWVFQATAGTTNGIR